MVSVIIPVYNAEKTIRNTVETVINQTYNDIEILLVNDGSKDNSKKICENFVEEYSNIKLINQDNAGASAARNIGIKNALGDWILFVDADDELFPWSIKELIAAVDQSTDVVVGCNSGVDLNEEVNFFLNYDVPSIKLAKATLAPNLYFDEVQNYLHLCNYGVCVGPPWGKLIRKSFLINNNIWFPEGQTHHEDTVFCLQLYLNLSSIKLLDAPIYRYKETRNSISGRFNQNKIDNMATVSKIAMTICDGNREMAVAVNSFVLARFLDCFLGYISHIDNKEDLFSIYKEIHKICEISVFNSFKYKEKSIEDCISKKNKFLLLLLRKNMYFLVSLLCVVMRIAKRIIRQ